MDYVLEAGSLRIIIMSIVLLSYRFYLTPTKDHLFLLCITIVQFPVYHPQLLLHIRMTARVTTPTTQINVDVDLCSTYIVIKDH